MKRISSILLIIFIFSLTFCVSAETDGSLIFDLDLSTYSQSETATDKSGNNIEVLLAKSTKPFYGSVTVNNKTTPYVSFYSSENQVATGFYLDDEKIRNLSDISVEAWINADSLSDGEDRTLFSISKTFANSSLISVFNNNVNSFYPDKKINETAVQADNMTDFTEKWTHYVCTRSYYTENEKKYVKYETYINGNLKGGNTVGITENTDEDGMMFYIGLPGKVASKNATFGGKLSELRIYNKSLTETEVLNKYFSQNESYIEKNPSSGDDSEEKGDVLFSLDMDAYDGTLKSLSDLTGNITSFEFTGTAPQKNEYSSVGGSTPYITFSEASNQAISFSADTVKNRTALTAEMWIRYENFLDRYQHPFALQSKSSGFSPESMNAGGTKFQFGPSGTTSRVSVSDISGKWTHLVFTRVYTADVGLMVYKLWLDGVLISETNFTGQSLDESTYTKFFIGHGGSNDVNNQFTGDIGKFVLYDKELTDNEIKEIYDGETEKFVSSYMWLKDDSPIACDAEKIEIKVADSVDLDNTDMENISLEYIPEGSNIKCNVEKDTANKIITLYPMEYLRDNSQYKFTVNSLALSGKDSKISTYIKFMTEGSDITVGTNLFNENNLPVTSLENISQLKIRFALENAVGKNISATAVCYNEENRATDLKTKTLSNGDILTVNCSENTNAVYVYLLDTTAKISLINIIKIK